MDQLPQFLRKSKVPATELWEIMSFFFLPGVPRKNGGRSFAGGWCGERNIVMDNPELDFLLAKNRFSFHWSESSGTWSLSTRLNEPGSLAVREHQPAVNIEEAQAAAIQVLLSLHMPENTRPPDSHQLDALLSQYRLTFNWGNPGMKWWLVGQNKGSNALSRTVPRPAKDIETAKADAVQYILEMHRATTPEEGEG